MRLEGWSRFSAEGLVGQRLPYRIQRRDSLHVEGFQVLWQIATGSAYDKPTPILVSTL